MVSITIRNVSKDTHDELAARAARAGKSLQEYLRGELEWLASKPDQEELWARIREEKAHYGARLSVDEILADRDADRK